MAKNLIQLRSEDIDPAGLMKVSRVAKLLDVGDSTVYEWIAAGKIPAYQNAQTKTVRIKADEFLRWVELYFKPTRKRLSN